MLEKFCLYGVLGFWSVSILLKALMTFDCVYWKSLCNQVDSIWSIKHYTSSATKNNLIKNKVVNYKDLVNAILKTDVWHSTLETVFLFKDVKTGEKETLWSEMYMVLLYLLWLI